MSSSGNRSDSIFLVLCLVEIQKMSCKSYKFLKINFQNR